MKILMLGNSFTSANQMPEILAAKVLASVLEEAEHGL